MRITHPRYAFAAVGVVVVALILAYFSGWGREFAGYLMWLFAAWVIIPVTPIALGLFAYWRIWKRNSGTGGDQDG